MPKPTVVYVDRSKTRTAADIASVEECDALIRRNARDIGEMNAQINEGRIEDCSRIRNTLRVRDMALTQLKQRRDQLVSG